MARPHRRPLHLQLLCVVAVSVATHAQDDPDAYTAPDARDAPAAHASGWLPPSPSPPPLPPPPGPGEDGVAGAALQDRQPGAPGPATAPTAKDSAAAAAAAAASSSLVPFAYTHGAVAGYGSPLGTGLAAAPGSLGAYAEPLAHLADHHQHHLAPHRPRGHHLDHHGDHHALHHDHLHQEHHYAEHDLEEEHHDKKSAAGHIAMGFLAYMAVLAVLQGGLIALTRGPSLWGVAARRRRDLTRVPTLDPTPPADPGPPGPPEPPAPSASTASATTPAQGRSSSRSPPRDAPGGEGEREDAGSGAGDGVGAGAGAGAGESDRCVEFGVCMLARQLSSQLGSTGRLLARYISAWAGLSLGRDLRTRAEAAGDAGLRLGDCARLFPGCAHRQRRHAPRSVDGAEVK